MIKVWRDRRFLDAAGLLLVIYFATLAILPKHVFWSPDEGAKWMAMHSVSVLGDLSYTVDFPSQRIDTDYKYLPHSGIFPRPDRQADGSIYLAFETPLLFPLLSSIPYRLVGIAGIYFLPLLSGWLAAVLAGVIARTMRKDSGPATVLVAGLATPVWFYSQLFWEHTLSSLLGMIAIAIVVIAPPRKLPALLIAMALPIAAMAFCLEVATLAPALLVAWAVAAYVTPTPRTDRDKDPLMPRSIMLIAGVILAFGLAAFLDALIPVRHQKLLALFPERLSWGWTVISQSPWSLVDILIHTSIQEAHPVDSVTVGIVMLGVLLCIAAAFARRPLIESLLLLLGLSPVLIFSVVLLTQWTTYRALHGLIPVAPFIVVWPYAWAACRRDQRGHAHVFLPLLLVVYLMSALFAIAATSVEEGRLEVGLEWGQRYLLTLYPIAAALCVVGVRNYWDSGRPAWLRKSFVAVVTLLIVVAFGFELRGLGMLFNTRFRLAIWDEAMRQEGPIVTDLWWLPAAVAVLFTQHEVYYVYGREQVAAWTADAQAHRAKGFTFVTSYPVEAADLPNAPVQRTSDRAKELYGISLTRFRIVPPG